MGMYELAKKLYPIHRSITGDGVRKSLEIIKEQIPIEIKEVPCGEKVFDWEIPPEWNIRDAYVLDLSSGKKVIDFKEHNLHIVGYSIAVDEELTYEELTPHLHYIEKQPSAIPYVFSYYEEQWGFCLSYEQFLKLDKKTKYKVFIDSDLDPQGSLTYAELIIPGENEEELFFSSYICHPQMCNNELSGPVLLTQLAKFVLDLKERRYTYRFIIIPETIGSITYLSKNLKHMKKKVFGGYNLTCVGDERVYSYIPSRLGNNISDRVAKYALSNFTDRFIEYSWLDRGSDERQYCAPGVDLPICSITRSKYQAYPEYHTSLDNFDLVTKKGLEQSFSLYSKIIHIFEKNIKPKIKVLGEPQLGKRGLYLNLSKKDSPSRIQDRDLKNFISYCDGNHSVLDITEILGLHFDECLVLLNILKDNNLLRSET